MRASVGPRYFETLKIPVLHGRPFTLEDTPDSTPVVVISEAMARAFWGRSDVVGERFRWQGVPDGWQDIVGVVADVKIRELTEAPTPLFYRSLGQGAGPSLYLVARSSRDASPLLPAMRTELTNIDPSLSALRLRTMDEHLSDGLALSRLGTRMVSGFGLLGLILASLGLYAVVAFSVQRRTREVGVRMALGAGKQQVARMVLGEVLIVVGIAVGVGIAASLLITPVIAGQLYNVPPVDPLTLAGTALLLTLTGAVATWLPARRAATVDPVTALRNQ